MKKTLLLLIYFFSYSLIAQSDTDKAKAYYFQAETQYENGNASKALEYLDQAETLIGSTNGSIEALRVKACYKTKQFEEAQTSLTNFYDNYANEAPTELQKEMSGYLVKIEEGIKEREATEKRKREQAKKEREAKQNARERERKESSIKREKELLDKRTSGVAGTSWENARIYEQLYREGFGLQYLLEAIVTYSQISYIQNNNKLSSHDSDVIAKKLYAEFLAKFKNPKWYLNLEDYSQFEYINNKVFYSIGGKFNFNYSFSQFHVRYLALLFYQSNDWAKYLETIELYNDLIIDSYYLQMKSNYKMANAYFHLKNCEKFKIYFSKFSKKGKRKNKEFRKFNETCGSR